MKLTEAPEPGKHHGQRTIGVQGAGLDQPGLLMGAFKALLCLLSRFPHSTGVPGISGVLSLPLAFTFFCPPGQPFLPLQSALVLP